MTQARSIQTDTVTALDVVTPVQQTVRNGRQDEQEHQQQQETEIGG